jgi:hypothetical protein
MCCWRRAKAVVVEGHVVEEVDGQAAMKWSTIKVTQADPYKSWAFETNLALHVLFVRPFFLVR